MRLILKPWGIGLVIGCIAILAILLVWTNQGRLGEPLAFLSATVPVSREGERVMVRCEGCGHDIPVAATDLKKVGAEAAMAAAQHDTLWERQGVLRLTAGEAQADGTRLNANPPVPGFRGTGALEFGSSGAAEWKLRVPEGGDYRLSVRYANPGAGGNAFRVFHQGATAGKVVADGLVAPQTGRKRAWEYLSLPVTMTAGDNLLRVAVTGDGKVFVDGIVLEKSAADGVIR